ncbi:sorbitol xylitol dehydrogenase protein [Rutstroemia sp. NJR-2017a BBW]|nr:sorbitol xylitol dehydrogenase protein [Rutstroemia sp. NJR-2017a BBW]
MRFAATPPYNGTLCRYYALPEDFCFKLPEHVSFEEGALVEPLSVAVHCVKLAGVRPGGSVFVLGAGPIGVLCAAVPRAFGASTILVADIVQSRLDFAQSYAATHTSLISADPLELQGLEVQTKADTSDGFDFVIDATGVESCIRCGVAALARGGTFVQVGI